MLITLPELAMADDFRQLAEECRVVRPKPTEAELAAHAARVSGWISSRISDFSRPSLPAASTPLLTKPTLSGISSI